jgi:hypothetical protein
MWSAGHSVSGVERVASVADLIDETLADYRLAQRQTLERLSP